jgi:hypothetical protein
MRRWLLIVAVLVATTPLYARSHSDNDRAGFGNDITVAEGETAGDIACAFCSVHIHGDVKGDIAVAYGSIDVDGGRSIGGDVAALGADLKLGPGSWVGGDVAMAAGDVIAAPGATIHGSSAVSPSRIWMLLPLSPFLVLGGLIWLIVWLVRRNRYQFPAYPQGRGF